MSSDSHSSSRRINVLTLDGGGVRGLSTLLILRKLMQEINLNLRNERDSEAPPQDPVEPHDVFDLVAGTSTGGLIAIMLGKLGMTIEQCIAAYHDLSGNIFGKKHLRARTNGGLAPSKYSGSRMRQCVRNLLQRHEFDQDLPMSSVQNRDKIACALVCREHRNRSRYSDFKSEAVCICSLPCPDAFECLVCDAARATSAAPTFFPVQNINDRYFADGGLEFNNPSHEIFDHYTRSARVAESKRTSVASEAAISASQHDNLDFSQVRFVNLGTGTEPSILDLRQAKLAFLVPGAIRMFLFLRKNLTKMAVNSERIAKQMETLAMVSGDRFCIKYDRLSADNGICFIKMDKFKKLQIIEDLTEEYLETDKVQQKLERMGRDIARDYLQKTEGSRRRRAAPRSLTVPEHSAHRPQTPTTRPSESSSANSASKQSSTEGASTAPSSVLGHSPSRQKQVAAEFETEEGEAAGQFPQAVIDT